MLSIEEALGSILSTKKTQITENIKYFHLRQHSSDITQGLIGPHEYLRNVRKGGKLPELAQLTDLHISCVLVGSMPT
jgi:hypothetical protein